jgi:ferric-dicitrate binding protein FerR (iron transport regulator)
MHNAAAPAPIRALPHLMDRQRERQATACAPHLLAGLESPQDEFAAALEHAQRIANSLPSLHHLTDLSPEPQASERKGQMLSALAFLAWLVVVALLSWAQTQQRPLP